MLHFLILLKKAVSRFTKKDRLIAINLSLSFLCNANCIFCPSNRGKRIKQKVMSFEYIQKIISEISSAKFKKYHNIERISISENGDAFLNTDFIKILRFIKLKVPYIRVDIFTNFSNFTKEKAEIILREGLIGTCYCNIDGSTNSNYFNVKRLDLNDTQRNIINFLEIREKLNCDIPLTICVITLHDYIHTIYNNFGFYPIKLSSNNLINLPDDFLLIKAQYEKILNSKKDKIVKSDIFGWAEREKVDTNKIDYNKYSCSFLHRIKKEAFIAPDGTWYACCLDSNNELVLGNVIKQSINKIFFNKKRRKLIKFLEKKEFASIGEPCNTVNCCQLLH